MRTRHVLLLLMFVLYPGFAGAQTANPGKYQYVFTVAQDGTGDYRFIQDAIDAMRVYPLAPIILYIKNGVYHEKINLPADNVDVSFIGESADSTIISFDDYSGKGALNTFTSYTAKISGNRFRAENICFENTAGQVGQALALYVDADKAVFKNCRFLGHQDTIFAAGENSRQLFQDCYIEGTTDFIFGPATVIFQRCTIRAKANSYITAASTSKRKSFGLVFMDCKVIADEGLDKIYLGRPWRSWAKTVFIRTSLPASIAPAGWHNWDNPANERTAFYAEYQNSGPGSNTKNRVQWSYALSSTQVKLYTTPSIFAQPNNGAMEKPAWYNKSSLQFDAGKFKGIPPQEIPLYEGAIPNARNTPDIETSTIGADGVLRIAKVSRPSITMYKPVKPNGKAVVICPGGGYAILAFDKEGTRVAEALCRQGITAIVLKYRLPDDQLEMDKSIAPLQDAQQALRYVRTHAKSLGVQPRKIGIMGFSAGGHLASTAATHFNFKADSLCTDTTSVRPDFTILIYPVISFDSSITHKGSRTNLVGKNPTDKVVKFFSNELQVTHDTGPTFLVHASDDPAVPVQNTLRYYEACIHNKVPASLFIFAKGGHGFGLKNQTSSDDWMDRLQHWLEDLK